MAELDDKTLKNLDQALQDMNSHLSDLDQWLKRLRKQSDVTFDPKLIAAWRDSIQSIDFSNITKKQLNELQRQISKVEKSLDKATHKYLFGIKGDTNAVSYNASVSVAREYLQLLKQINAQEVINKANSSPSKMTEKVVTKESLEAQKKITDELKKQEQQYKKNNNEIKRQKGTLDNMLPTIQRLASAFGIAFSVRGLAQFGKKLIETRGEFEMQFVAMKQIIGDVDSATKIWNQTMQQALQSPFKAMQLVTYTKQLAAYRIETEKLFDTTKRLADVSAGLGVDMGRLILAYGQVKSANFLRASEVRQFTEAGVNIAGNLAKYFSELEGRAVGTAEVMERITKRMVLFSDVEAIFKRMTDEGGEFFNMQEVQADTVKGQIQKLHDAYDQMLNTIGQANQGTIRNFVDALNNLVRNWQNVAFVLKANINWITLFGASLFALSNNYMKGATTQTLWFGKALLGNDKVLLKNVADVRIFSKALGDFTLKQRVAIVATRTFQSALSAVGNVMKTLWPLLVFEGITLLVERLTRANRELKRFREELQEVASTNVGQMDDEINGYDSLIERLKRTTEGTMARKEVLDEISRRYGKYLDFIITETTSVEQLAGAYDKVVLSIRNYTAEKIREEQMQRVEKGIYDEYQGLISNLIGSRNFNTDTGLSKDQAKAFAKYVQSAVKEGVTDSKKIIEDYFKIELPTSANTPMMHFVRTYIDQYKNMYSELQDIRDDVEGATPVFATDAEYQTYKKNVDDANKEIVAQNELYQQQVDLVKQKTEEQWKIDDEIAKLRLENEEKILGIRKEYGLISEGQYNDELARLHGRLDTYETDYNQRLESAMVSKYGIFWKTTNKEARDMYNYVVSTEQALAQGTTQRNKQLKESYKGFKDSLEQYNAQYQAAVNSGASKESLDKIQADIDLAQLMMAAIELAAELRGIDLSEKKKTGGRKENASKLISLIKEMRSEYDKLSKSAYGYAKSEEKVRESYKDSVREILGKAGITDYDFTTNEGMIKALEKVKSYATRLGKDAAAEVQKYIDQLETEIEINAQVRIREDFGREIEEMFKNYELTVELQKINLPEDAAKELFGFDYKSLNDILERTKRFRTDLGEDFDEEDEKVYTNWLNKVEDKLFQIRKERAKEYTKYLEQELSERAKLEMQYVKDVSFVEATFQNGEQKTAIIDNLKKNYEQSLKELQWKSFKESDFYVEMMQDLTSMPSEYLDLMMQKLDEWANKADALSPRALKEVLKAREKVLEAQVALSPVRALNQSLGVIRGFQGDTSRVDENGNQIVISKYIKESRKQLQGIIAERAKSILQMQDELDIQEALLGKIKAQEEIQETLSQLSQRGVGGISITSNAESDLANIDTQIEQQQNWLDAMEEVVRKEGENEEAFARRQRMYEDERKEINIVIELLKQLRLLREQADKAGLDPTANLSASKMGTVANVNRLRKSISDAEKLQATDQGIMSGGYAAWNKAVHGLFKNISSVTSKVKDLGNQFYDTLEAVGVETNAVSDAWMELGNGIFDTITQTLELIPSLITGFEATGAAVNTAMGVIGLIAEAIQLTLMLIKGIAKIHDAKLELEIERQQENIDNLRRAYERLEKQIEKTWSTVSYIRTYREETQNLYEQYEALANQINAEEAKKNTDKDKLQDYQDKQQEILDTLEEIKQQQIEVFGGIGEDSYRSAAEGFVDAWKSAFLETGDGLQGLQDHFDEFLNDWFVKQATMRIAGKTLEPLFRQIEDAVDMYGEGDSNVLMSELQKVWEKAGIILPDLSEKLEQIAGWWGLGGEGSLSGLAAGIQGMTEEQANILEAYWNSVRMYSANIDMNVTRIAQILGAGGDNTNPMLSEMERVRENTDNIRNLLNMVSFSGGEGLGFRVYSF